LPAFFSDGMVIAKEAKIWGWASPAQKITVGFLNEIYEATADGDGRFHVTLITPEYGGPYIVTVNEITLRDVYVGRVWLCGGSSNMEEPTSRGQLVRGEDVPEDMRIRVFQGERGHDFNVPARDIKGEWHTASGWFLAYMNAVPYFFAQDLLERDPSPIGLICIPVGGTTIEGWMPEEALGAFPEYAGKLVNLRKPGWIERTQTESDWRTTIWKETLEIKDKGRVEGWHMEDYDDSQWDSKMLFDNAGLPRHGSVWLRRKFDMPATNSPVTLRFGRVENSVTVYINGVEVVSINYMFPPCACVIPDGVLKEGENSIAVRIVGESHSPTVVAGKEYALIFPEGRVELNGKWQRRTGTAMPMCQPEVYLFSNPCGVYNYMLAPLLGYSIDGVIWSQGEANTANPQDYKDLFTTFVKHIRKYFGEVPVIYTQIANYVDPYSYNFIEGFGAPGEYWAILREQQRLCLEIPNTAMAVTIDCGEHNDLHPTDKKTVGKRMALHARRLAYGEDIVSDGPMVERALHQGGRLTIFFKHGEGLWEKYGHPLIDVVDMEGAVHRLYAAVWNNALNMFVGNMNPAAVRFGWVDCPVVPLYNAYGLPASPFEIEVTHT